MYDGISYTRPNATHLELMVKSEGVSELMENTSSEENGVSVT